MPSHGDIARRDHDEMGIKMSENDESGTGKLEEAADEGRLPGVEEVDAAEEEGRDTSETPGSSGADDDGETPSGGVVMGAVNQH